MNTYILTYSIKDTGNNQNIYDAIHQVIEIYSNDYKFDDTTSTIFYTTDKNNIITNVIKAFLRKYDEVKIINLIEFELIKISDGETFRTTDTSYLFD